MLLLTDRFPNVVLVVVGQVAAVQVARLRPLLGELTPNDSACNTGLARLLNRINQMGMKAGLSA